MQSQVAFSLMTSGLPAKIPNSTVNTTSIVLTYAVNGGPTSLTVVAEGCKNAGGEFLLDTYNSTSSTIRTIALSDTYDYFQVTAIFSGGTNVSVDSTLYSGSGAGATFSAALNLTNIHVV